MNTIGLISSFILSMHWPKLMEHWHKIECLPIFRKCTYKSVYVHRIRWITSIALVLALGILFHLIIQFWFEFVMNFAICLKLNIGCMLVQRFILFRYIKEMSISLPILWTIYFHRYLLKTNHFQCILRFCSVGSMKLRFSRGTTSVWSNV